MKKSVHHTEFLKDKNIKKDIILDLDNGALSISVFGDGIHELWVRFLNESISFKTKNFTRKINLINVFLENCILMEYHINKKPDVSYYEYTFFKGENIYFFSLEKNYQMENFITPFGSESKWLNETYSNDIFNHLNHSFVLYNRMAEIDFSLTP